MVASAPPVVETARASRLGLWIALGLHACLIAAACSLTFTSTDEIPKVDNEIFIDRGAFEMPISIREPQKNNPDRSVTSAPLPAPPPLPLVALEHLTALRYEPFFEPIAAVTADPASAPAKKPMAGESTRKSPSPSTTRTGKTASGKGNGTGKRMK